MSRRITMFAIAASAALIGTQARADRECFENSCRLPEVIEPSPPVPDEAAPPKPAAPAADSHASVSRIVHELPAEPSIRHPLPEPMQKAEDKTEDQPREPARSAPRPRKVASAPARQVAAHHEAATTPVRVSEVRVAPAEDRPALAPERNHGDRRYATGERAFGSGALIINVPPASYATDGLAAVRPYVFYSEPHAPRLYVLAPNAKIISVDDSN